MNQNSLLKPKIKTGFDYMVGFGSVNLMNTALITIQTKQQFHKPCITMYKKPTCHDYGTG